MLEPVDADVERGKEEEEDDDDDWELDERRRRQLSVALCALGVFAWCGLVYELLFFAALHPAVVMTLLPVALSTAFVVALSDRGDTRNERRAAQAWRATLTRVMALLFVMVMWLLAVYRLWLCPVTNREVNAVLSDQFAALGTFMPGEDDLSDDDEGGVLKDILLAGTAAATGDPAVDFWDMQKHAALMRRVLRRAYRADRRVIAGINTFQIMAFGIIGALARYAVAPVRIKK